MKMKTKAERNSSVELLKIIAVIMIVFSHAIPNSGAGGTEWFMDLSVATTSVQQLVLVLFKYSGQIGNDIFVVSSAWFLLNSKSAKLEKAMDIVLDSVIVSLLILMVFEIEGYNLSLTEIVKHFIPITMNNNWYVGCYLILYLIHPALNIIIFNISKEKLLLTNLITIFTYCGINLLVHDRFYYTQLVGFICIYFMVAYVKLYMKDFVVSRQRNMRVFGCAAVGLLGMILGTNFLGLKIGFLANRVAYWSIIINPFIIVMAISLLNLANTKSYVNKGINYISSLSLLVYMIHADRLFMDYAKMDLFAWIYEQYSYEYILVYVLIVGFILLALGIFFGILYKETIQRLRKKVCDVLYPRMAKCLVPMYKRILKAS